VTNPFIHTRTWIVSADINVGGVVTEIERAVEADTLADAVIEAEDAVLNAIGEMYGESGAVIGYYDIWDVCMAEEGKHA
jgi:hypothetical protein